MEIMNGNRADGDTRRERERAKKESYLLLDSATYDNKDAQEGERKFIYLILMDFNAIAC